MKWTEDENNKLIELSNNGFTRNEIAKVLLRTIDSVKGQCKKLNLESKNHKLKEWSESEISILIELKERDLRPIDMTKYLNRSISGIEKMLTRQRNKGNNVKRSPRLNKIKNIDWNYVIEKSKEFSKLEELYNYFDFSNKIYYKAIKEKLIPSLFPRKILKKEKKYKSQKGKEGYEFRKKCKFKFNVYHYPDYFDLNLIEELGWYSAKNRGNNFKGIVRDHIYSINDGLINNINPELLSHPANCKLIKHSDNIKKNKKSNITIEELLLKIKTFDNKYNGTVPK